MKKFIRIVFITFACCFVSLYKFYISVNFSDRRATTEPIPGASVENLFWFVQVSDIHISKFQDPTRASDFRKFCYTTLKTIKPDIVLLTGDITDAKTSDGYNSMQQKQEWQTYAKIINETRVAEKFIFLDIKGNHDNFDVARVNDPNSNFYLKYSADKRMLSSKVYHHKKSYGTYSFIPVDATMIPGPRRPYNFNGYLTEKRMSLLESFSEEIIDSNFTIWYSHYPTSVITTPQPGLRSVIGKKGGAYLAGHFHTQNGFANELYAMNTKGFLELGLADWMVNRKYRVVAIDHDLLSFTDIRYGQWPVVVLTNPKESKFMMPDAEPLGRIKNSTHIRFLIFDPWGVEHVEISIDDAPLSVKAENVNSTPLWVCRWDTGLYLNGMHVITITVIDTRGNKQTVKQKFSLETAWSRDIDVTASFYLLTDFAAVGYFGFYILAFGYVVVLLFLRYIGSSITKFKTPVKDELCFLLQDDYTFYPVFLFALNLIFGPWFIGELIRGETGACFSYGILIQGKMLPEQKLYFDGMIEVSFYYFPAILFLAFLNNSRKKKAYGTNRSSSTFITLKRWIVILIYFIYILFHFSACRTIYNTYGLMATLICPVQSWWLLFILLNSLRIFFPKRISKDEVLKRLWNFVQ